MVDETIRFKELSAIHAIDGCNGAMVPKFVYVTSQARLHITGYCIKCGVNLVMQYDLAELEKIYPGPMDKNSRSELSISPVPEVPQLTDFEPPSGSKPQ
jgi:hypothetical protein